jgi:hypothetical protein
LRRPDAKGRQPAPHPREADAEAVEEARRYEFSTVKENLKAL